MWIRAPDERIAQWREFRLSMAKQVCTVGIQEVLCDISVWWEQMPFVNMAIDPYNARGWPSAWEIIDSGHCCKYSRGLAMAYTIHYIDPTTAVTLARVRNKDHSDQYMVAIWNDRFVINTPHTRLVDLKSDDIFDIEESWLVQDGALLII